MSNIINISKRGTLTLPKELRERYGLDRDDAQVIAQETDEGILLKPGAVFPIERYSNKRIAEFNKENEEALGEYRVEEK